MGSDSEDDIPLGQLQGKQSGAAGHTGASSQAKNGGDDSESEAQLSSDDEPRAANLTARGRPVKLAASSAAPSRANSKRGRATGAVKAGTKRGRRDDDEDDDEDGEWQGSDEDEDDRKPKGRGKGTDKGMAAGGNKRGRGGASSASSRPRASKPKPASRRSRRNDSEDEDDDEASARSARDEDDDEDEASSSEEERPRRRARAKKASKPSPAARKGSASRRPSAAAPTRPSPRDGPRRDSSRYLAGKNDARAVDKDRGLYGYDEADLASEDEDEEDEEEEEEEAGPGFYARVDMERAEQDEEEAKEEGLGIGLEAGTKMSKKGALDAYLRFLVAALVCPDLMREFCYDKRKSPDATAWHEAMRLVETRVAAATKSMGESEAWRDDVGQRDRSTLPYVKSAIRCLPYFEVVRRKARRRPRRAMDEEDEGEYGDGFEYAQDGNGDDEDEDGLDGEGKVAGIDEDACHACRRIRHPGTVTMTLTGPLVPSDQLCKDVKEWLDYIPRGEFRQHRFTMSVGGKCAERVALASVLQHWKYKQLLNMSRMVAQSVAKGDTNWEVESYQDHIGRVAMETEHLLAYAGGRAVRGRGSPGHPEVDEDEAEGWEDGAVTDACRFTKGISMHALAVMESKDRAGAGSSAARHPSSSSSGHVKPSAADSDDDDDDDVVEVASSGDDEDGEGQALGEFEDDEIILKDRQSVRALTWAGDPTRRSFLRSNSPLLVWMYSRDRRDRPAELEYSKAVPRPAEDKDGGPC